MPSVPLYKEQGVVLRSVKLGEADKIVTVMTQGSGKVRAVAKGIRKTTSRFGARLEPFTHVSLMVYRGRGSLDTVSQAEIGSPFRSLRGDLGLFAAGRPCWRPSTRSPRSTSGTSAYSCSCSTGMRALDARPADPAAVAESFLLKLLSLSGFHPALTTCAVCGAPAPSASRAASGARSGAADARSGRGPASLEALDFLATLGGTGCLRRGRQGRYGG